MTVPNYILLTLSWSSKWLLSKKFPDRLPVRVHLLQTIHALNSANRNILLLTKSTKQGPS
jgi:hypothetical protein